jgi:hypothetical protein
MIASMSLTNNGVLAQMDKRTWGGLFWPVLFLLTVVVQSFEPAISFGTSWIVTFVYSAVILLLCSATFGRFRGRAWNIGAILGQNLRILFKL